MGPYLTAGLAGQEDNERAEEDGPASLAAVLPHGTLQGQAGTVHLLLAVSHGLQWQQATWCTTIVRVLS